MSIINPYIGFNGKTREAMTFYQAVFGGELDLQQVAGSPMEQQWPSAQADAIFHSVLTSDKVLIMGSDMTGPGGQIEGTNISLGLTCSSEEEINTWFNKLAEGGVVMDPLKDQFWGAIFGAVQDKYGIRWMLNYDKKS
jgi:PhnB protein